MLGETNTVCSEEHIAGLLFDYNPTSNSVFGLVKQSAPFHSPSALKPKPLASIAPHLIKAKKKYTARYLIVICHSNPKPPEMRTAQHTPPPPPPVTPVISGSREKMSLQVPMVTVGEFALATPQSLLKLNDVNNEWVKKIIAVEDATYAQASLALCLNCDDLLCIYSVIRSSNIRNSYYRVTYFTLLASPAISFIIP